MIYVALLYSPQLDQFETDCNNLCYCAADLAEWVGALANHYNHHFGVDDFYIISINKMGE